MYYTLETVEESLLETDRMTHHKYANLIEIVLNRVIHQTPISSKDVLVIFDKIGIYRNDIDECTTIAIPFDLELPYSIKVFTAKVYDDGNVVLSKPLTYHGVKDFNFNTLNGMSIEIKVKF